MNVTKEKTAGFFIITLLSVLALTVITRVVSVTYSTLVNDIVYMDSVWIYILEYAITIINLIIRSIEYASVIWAFMFIGKRNGIKSAALILVVELLNSASAFIIDVIQNNISGREIIAALSLLIDFLVGVAMISAVAIIANLIAKKYKARDEIESLFSLSNPPQKAILYSTAAVLGANILIELSRTIEFLFEVSFSLYEGELLSIISAYVEIIIINGILTFICITCFYMLINHIMRRKL